jgi:hypothetical protein
VRRDVLKRARAILAAVRASNDGATAVFTALSLAAILACVAVGLETGRLVHVQRRMQDSVDNAAIAAMLARRADPAADPTSVARAILDREAFLADPSAVVAVEWPPADGEERGNPDAILIRAAIPSPVRLGMLIGSKPLTVGAVGAARLVDVGSGCVMALAPGPAPTVTGTDRLSSDGCEVLSVGSGATATRLDDADPWSGIAPAAGGCRFTGLNVRLLRILKASAQPWTFCGETRIRAPALAYLLPGTYAVAGRLTVESHAHLIARGVTLVVLPGGSLDIEPGATIDLSAPDTGPLAGLAIAGTAAASGTSSLLGGARQSISGAVHLPAQNLIVAGSGQSDCLQLIAATIDVRGSTRVGCSRAAVRPIRERVARLYG